MKVLVTGIDGYIGTRMGEYLLDRGHEVHGLDTGFYREGWLYNGVKKVPSVTLKDTRDVQKEDLIGYDAIIHLADLSNDPLVKNNPELTYEINHKACVRLATLAKEAGVKRFIFSSSCSAYGIATEDVVSETSVPQPQTAYAECKILVENDLKKLADENFCPTFMRNATVYGPSPRMRFDLVVNDLSGLAFTTNEIKMNSDGSPWRPLVHIMDVCQAFACVLEADTDIVRGEIFNVGDSSGNYRVREVAEIVANVFPGCKLTFGISDGDTRSYKVNFDKIATKVPGFKCKYTVSDGVKELKAIFEKISMTPEVFKYRAYTRLKELEYLKETGQIDGNLVWKS